MLARFWMLKLGSVARMRPLMAVNSAQCSQPSLENAHTVLLKACVRARRKKFTNMCRFSVSNSFTV